MNVAELIVEQALVSGVYLFLDEDKLKYRTREGEIEKALMIEIKNNKTSIIEYLKSVKQFSDREFYRIKRYTKTENPPLSYSQQRLWLIDKIQGSTQYNQPHLFELNGEFNQDAFQKAISSLIERHQVLRTVYIEDENEIYQKVKEDFNVIVERDSLEALTLELQKVKIQYKAQTEANRPFDLSKDLMLRTSILTLSNSKHILLLTIHHIATDGMSQAILMNELSLLYSNNIQGNTISFPQLTVQYSDYAQWQRDWLKSDELQCQLTYWNKRLTELPSVHSLPLDKRRPLEQTFNGSTVHQELDDELTGQIKSFCNVKEVTLFMMLQTAFALIISRYSNNTDIIMGTPIAGRAQKELAPLVGFFINTLLLRTDLRGNPRFDTLLETSKEHIFEAFAHQDIPFDFLVNELKPERSTSYNPLFQIMFTLQNMTMNQLELDNLVLKPITPSHTSSLCDLQLTVVDMGERISIVWGYNSDLFHATTIERMANNFLILLKSIIINSQEEVQSLNILSRNEYALLNECNGTDNDYSKTFCIHELFQQRVEQSPNAIALSFDQTSLNYSELNYKANQIAHYLVENYHIKPDTLVGICIENSLDLVVGILAVLKSGGTYVPLDPNYPDARLKFIVNDANISIVLTHSYLCESTPINDNQTVCLDDTTFLRTLHNYSGQNLSSAKLGLKLSNLAYVIYTSGSTGQPKGVMIEHQSVTNLAYNIDGIGLLENAQQWAWFASFSFDASIQGITQLAFGKSLVIISEQLKRDPIALANILPNIGVIDCTPSVVESWFVAGIEDKLPNLIVGGEAISEKLWTLLVKWQAKWNKKAINVYGPTECTVNTTYHTISGERTHIGNNLSNVSTFILDQNLNFKPIGATGELYIGGTGLARGYVNNSGLTATSFIPNPFYNENDASSSTRLYKTGDLARRMADGNLEFQGRIDHQVKIRGFRIELGEIEHVLNSHEAVKDVIVIAKNKQLVAYVVANIEKQYDDGLVLFSKTDSIALLRGYVGSYLPEYMVPSAFFLLDELPMTYSCKVDRKALPDISILQSEYIRPITKTELILCEIWQEMLSLERIGITDNFFELGGHSLMVIGLIKRINSTFNVQLRPTNLFELQNIKLIADYIEKDAEQFNIMANSSNESVVLLKQGNKALEPMYFIHPVGGKIVCYLTLINSLNYEGCIYAIQKNNPGLSGIEQMAETYADIISSHNNQLPCRLVGWSMGGVIAYEMAQKNNKIAIVDIIMIDSFNPGIIPSSATLSEQEHHSNIFSLLCIELGISFESMNHDYFSLTLDELLELGLLLGKKQGIFMSDFSLEELSTYFYTLLENHLSFLAYKPKNYVGKVHLIKSSEGAEKMPHGWDELVTDLSTTIIEGDHYSIMTKPSVLATVVQINKIVSM